MRRAAPLHQSHSSAGVAIARCIEWPINSPCRGEVRPYEYIRADTAAQSAC